MLAVHFHEMDASRPRGNMPFGYHFDHNANPDYALPTPPMPAPGPSLLDDTETNLLDSFFHGVGSESFNYDFFANTNDTSPLGTPWNDISTAFTDATSSFAAPTAPLQQAPSSAVQPSRHEMTPSMYAMSPVKPEPTQDVLAAATLLHNSSNGLRSMSISGPPSAGYDPMLTALASRGISPYETMNSSSLQQSSQQQSSYVAPTPTHAPYFFNAGQGLPLLPPNPQARVLRFGSDPTFGAVPPTTMTAAHLAEQQAFEPSRMQAPSIDSYFQPTGESSTAGTSEPTSPTTLRPGVQSPSLGLLAEGFCEFDDGQSKPRKGHFGSSDDDDEDEDDEFPMDVSPRKNANSKRPSIAKPREAQVAHGTPSSKRRKSTTGIGASNAIKAARENLTEDQKRENHIRSEQKRRQQIKDGFDDLHDLVPGLKVGGFSKSAVLTLAADWLEELLATNEAMKQRIALLRGHGRTGM